MENGIGTVCCLLCRGTINFKNNNRMVFVNHMKDQHNAFHNIDYMLASCFLPAQQLVRVAETLEESLREEPMEEEAEKPQQVDMEETETQAKRRKYGEGEFKCDQCDRKYSTKFNMVAHMKRQHGSNMGIKQELVESHIAGEDATSEEDYETNETGTLQNAEESSKEVVMLSCEECPKKFISSQGLAVHNSRMHKSEQRDVTCEYANCGKTFPKKNNLRNHEVVVHKRMPTKRGRPGKAPVGSVFGYSSEDFGSAAESDNTVEDIIAMGDAKMVGIVADNEEKMCEPKEAEEPQISIMADDEVEMVEPKEAEVSKISSIQDSDEASDSPARLECAFHCGKSFTAKSNLAQHEIKKHNRPLKRKGRGYRSTTEPDATVPHMKESETTSTEEQISEDTAETTEDTSWAELTDPNLGDFETDEEEADEASGRVENMPGPDLTASEYFTKYPKAVAKPQEHSVHLFTEPAAGLPAGWRERRLQDPRDEARTLRHFLSPDPDSRVLKTGQGVAEFLRLEGSLATGQLLRIARTVLLLSENKIKALGLTD
jgi:hypothetical protein